MDYATFRGIVALVILVAFIGVVLWAYSSRRKASFDRAANSIFDDEPRVTPADPKGESKE